MADFIPVTEEDFAPRAPAGTNPATGKKFTTQEVLREVLGPSSKAAEIEPSFVKRMLAGAGHAFQNKLAGLQDKPPVPDYGLSEDTAGGLGQMLPDAVGSMAVPATIPAQAAYGAVSRAIEPGATLLDRGVNAAKGVAEFGGGQAVASGIIKGSNAAAGNLTREGQVASAAGLNKLDLTAGDIVDSKLLRRLEEGSFKSPSKGQAEQVANLMADIKNNPLTNAVMNAYTTAQAKVSDAASRLDGIISTQNLPAVVPRETYAALRAVGNHSPTTLNAIGDPALRQIISDIITYPPNQTPRGMSFSQLDELRRTLGPIVSKIEMQSKSGASNINVADANRWKQVYKGIMNDIDGWGSTKATADALAAHKELSSTFKNEILPLREHPVAGKVIDGGYERPEDLVRDIALSQRNTTINKQLYDRLDQGGKNAFDAFRLTQRGAREFVRGESDPGWAKPLAISAGLTAPAWAPHAMTMMPWLAGAGVVEQGVVHALNSRPGRAILSGTNQAATHPLRNAATHSGLRTGAQGALQEYNRR